MKHNAPSWSFNKSLGQSEIRQRRTCKNLLKNSNIKGKNQIYYSSQSEHSLIIHQIPANSAKQQKKLQRCLDHVRELTRSRKLSTKRGGEHHIATGHGPMVQGGLLTAHPGGVHGDGGAPGGGSSFRQGAGAVFPRSPDIETAATVVQRGYREKDF